MHARDRPLASTALLLAPTSVRHSDRTFPQHCKELVFVLSVSSSQHVQRYVHQYVAAAEPWHDPRPAWADVRLRQFLAEGHGRGGRVIAAVKRLLDCSLGRVDDLLRAWYKDRVKGLLGIVRATCHVLEGGRRHIGKARALLRVILQNSEGSLQAQCRRRSLVRTALRTTGRG